MPKYITHFTFLFFAFVVGTGIWMRIYPFSPSRVPYDHLLHAHSHVAFLGWVFLGLLLIFLKIIWTNIKSKKHVHFMIITVIIVTILMFFAYIYQGYDVFSIIMATLHIFVEYWVALFIYLQMKKSRLFSKTASLYIKGALIALVISSIGPFLLGFIAAKGLQDSYLFEMTIYFYLHFQYNGWFLLFLIGLFITIIQSKKIKVNELLMKRAFWLYLISLFPGYLHSVLWVDLGTAATIVSAIGVVGQWIAIICIVYALKGISPAISKHFGKFIKNSILFVLALLVIKHSLELGMIIPGLAGLVYDTRSVVIGYLHFTLLGFVSMFILVQLTMIQILSPSHLAIKGAWIFFLGFLLNEVLLFTQGLTEWLAFSSVPFYLEGLLLAAILLGIGVLYLWISYKNTKIV